MVGSAWLVLPLVQRPAALSMQPVQFANVCSSVRSLRIIYAFPVACSPWMHALGALHAAQDCGSLSQSLSLGLVLGLQLSSEGPASMLKEACLVAFVVVDVGKRVLDNRRKKRASVYPSRCATLPADVWSCPGLHAECQDPACLPQGGHRRCWRSSGRSGRRWPSPLPVPSRMRQPLPCCGSRRCHTWASKPC
jgi:hypothetical protein